MMRDSMDCHGGRVRFGTGTELECAWSFWQRLSRPFYLAISSKLVLNVTWLFWVVFCSMEEQSLCILRKFLLKGLHVSMTNNYDFKFHAYTLFLVSIVFGLLVLPCIGTLPALSPFSLEVFSSSAFPQPKRVTFLCLSKYKRVAP